MRILITNSVPLNGGDEALLVATMLGIKEIFPDAHFNVLCNDAINTRKYIDYVDIDWDWECSILNSGSSITDKLILTARKLLNKIGIPYYSSISIKLAGQEEKKIIQLYKDADYVVSSAGGYIHDLYGYDLRMQAYFLALKLNKKLLFFGQSIGPFFARNNNKHRKLLTIFARSEQIYLREDLSKKHLNSIGYNRENVTVTTDIAFSLYRHYKHLFRPNKPDKNKIVVSFREWSYATSTENVVKIATNVVMHLIDKGYDVNFISTCQGLPYYCDDSELAILIKEKLPSNIKHRFTIDTTKYPLVKLIETYSQFNAYIGMRLHGAILAMIGGTPAFNLGYEDKTAGIYTSCGIPKFQANFMDDITDILSSIEYFLSNLGNIKLKEIVEGASERALTNFRVFK